MTCIQSESLHLKLYKRVFVHILPCYSTPFFVMNLFVLSSLYREIRQINAYSVDGKKLEATARLWGFASSLPGQGNVNENSSYSVSVTERPTALQYISLNISLTYISVMFFFPISILFFSC